MSFKILHFTTTCSLNRSPGSFPQRKGEGTGMWIAERISHSTCTRQASLRLSERAVLFAPLGCCPHPPHPSSLHLACHWASILSQSSSRIFLKPLFRTGLLSVLFAVISLSLYYGSWEGLILFLKSLRE